MNNSTDIQFVNQVKTHIYSTNYLFHFSSPSCRLRQRKRRASTSTWTARRQDTPPPRRRRFSSLSRTDSLSNDKLENLLKEIKANRDGEKNSSCLGNEKDKDSLELPPPCTCPYFGDKSPPHHKVLKQTEVQIIPMFKKCDTDLPTSGTSKSLSILPTTATTSPNRKLSYSKPNSVVTWDSRRHQRRGSSFGGARTSLLLTPTKSANSQLRRSATLRQQNNIVNGDGSFEKNSKIPSSPCLLQRSTTIRSHHSRNSSVISRNSSRHGRIIRLEQKATKVLGVVFFTFVILWAPFFVLNLVPTVCGSCEDNISHWVFDFVTWLGYASSMVNPIFYTIFNKVFRQAFKKVLLCEYRKKTGWRPQR